jgi:hypothetical protein
MTRPRKAFSESGSSWGSIASLFLGLIFTCLYIAAVPSGASAAGAFTSMETTGGFAMAPLAGASVTGGSSEVLAGPNAGSGAGEVANPRAVAVDQSDGTVYVGEGNNDRISEFDSTGHFLRAFGFGVRTGVPELQACTTFCEQGISGPAPGEMNPLSVAVDNSGGPSAHDVYVFDELKYRVEKYTSSGEFLLMFGKEVNKTKVAQSGSSEAEQNLCTEAELQAGDTCSDGSPGTSLGAFGLTSIQYHPVAVDASGAVWVGEPERLEQFSPAGVFLSEVKLPGVGVVESLAMDGSGDSYTITPPVDEIQEFTVPSSGTFTFSFEGQTTPPLRFEAGREPEGIREGLEGLSTIGQGNVSASYEKGMFGVGFKGALSGTNVPQMTISTGTSTTIRQGVPGRVDEFNSSGELVKTLDAEGHPNALALDPATGDLFVSDQIEPGTTRYSGISTLLEYDSSGAQIEAFGAGEVIGGPYGNALAFGDIAGRLYVVSSFTEAQSALQAFGLPAPGPLVEHGTTKATSVGKTAATLTAEVDPEGRETTFHFQYVDERSFETEGGFSSPHTVTTSDSGSIGQDFADHMALFEIVSGQLKPATVYRFRVVAGNENAPAGGTVGEEATFETEPAARVDSTSVAEVTADAATLQAEVNPLGDATEYRFEYLTEAGFQAGGESFSGPDPPVLVPQPDGVVGSGGEDVFVARHLQGLSANTVYRYRVVARNVAGTQAGLTGSFTTQAFGGGSAVLDGRSWELVSPVDKHGASIFGVNELAVVQAAAQGDAMTFEASSPTEAEPQGNSNGTQVFSSRTRDGWVSRDINVPHENVTGTGVGIGGEYRLFSDDLSHGVVQPFGVFVPSLSAEASEQTAFLRTDYVNGNVAESCVGSCYRPLVTGAPSYANVPPGTAFATCGSGVGVICGPAFSRATRDLRHIVLTSRQPLEPRARPNGLYEWTNGKLTYLPGGNSQTETPSVKHGISDDGTRVFSNPQGPGGEISLVVHETVSEETLQLDVAEQACLEKSECTSGGGTFQIASSSGSKVFFTDENRLTNSSTAASRAPDLYEYDFDAPQGERLTDLTVDPNPGERANVQGSVVGASEDGSWVYFVADGALAQGAVKGTCGGTDRESPGLLCNLYAWHNGAISLVAVLSGRDYPNWAGNTKLQVARVSPDGEWLAFMSQRSLTGYDNRDASSGNADEEVFLYNAAGAGRTVCASCDPTGARPVGTEYVNIIEREGGGIDGIQHVWNEHRWIASNIPGWSIVGGLYQPRDLSDSGRLFFNSGDSLVAQDINGKEDVYEYEPPGVGGCSTASPVFSERSDGCVGLVSSGSSAQDSGFLDASESGGDVFFMTTAKLALQDYDGAYDVYDAHVCRSSSPCFSSPVSPLACTTAEGCRAAPVPQPVIFGAPSSATFSGVGNALAPASTAVKARSLTRAQKLARALQTCTHKPNKKRLACRRRAKRAYSSRHNANGGR